MPKRPGFLTHEQVQAVLAAAGKRDRALIHLLYAYGLRITEGLTLKREQLDSRRIEIVRLKGSVPNVYPMLPDVWQSVEPWLGQPGVLGPMLDGAVWLFPGRFGGHLSKCGGEKAVRLVCLRAGIENEKAHCHIFKHSIITHLLAQGIPAPQVAAWVGHASLASTLVYAERDDKPNIASVFNVLTGATQPPGRGRRPRLGRRVVT